MKKNIYFIAVIILFNCQFKLYKCSQNSNNTAWQKYLDDFIQDVEEQSQKQSDTECVKTVIRLLKSVQNHTLWATWIWDSMASTPVGYLTGTQHQMGNAKQCLSPPWAKSHPEFRTKYCMADVEPKGPYLSINKTDSISPFVAASSYSHMPRKIFKKASSISWGLCLPESCDIEFMKTFVSILLKHNYFDKDFSKTTTTFKKCQIAQESKPLVAVDYVYIALFAALTVLTVSSACLLKKDGNSTVMEIARAFSTTENIDKLTRTSPDELDALNGIRFLSAAVIVIYHHLFMPGLFVPVNSKLEVEETYQKDQKYKMIYILPLTVDTFFVLSGLLLVRPLMKALDKMQWKSYMKLIVKRYFRLAPIFAVAILALIHDLENTHGSPVWADSANMFVDHCYKNWWVSLLMLSNYVHAEEMCHPPSWTVPCDFHMTVIAIGIVYLYSKQRRAGIAAFVILVCLSVILPGVTTYLYNLQALGDTTEMTVEEALKQPYQLLIYIKTHNRIGSYTIGMMLGYVMSVYEPNKYKKTISKGLSILGTIVSFVFIVGVPFMSALQTYGGYSRTEVILYAATHRIVFSTAIALLIVCLVYGTVPLINDFLCWKVFRPLARLSYGIYLIHMIIIIKKYSMNTLVADLSAESLAIDAIGILVLSVLASFFTWILVESPINHLCNYLLKPAKSKDTKMTIDTVQENEMREAKNVAV